MATPDVIDRSAALETAEPEMNFRPLAAPASWVVGTLLVALSCFHYYTAGFGLLRETTHRGVHLAFVLGLIFLVYGARRDPGDRAPAASTLWRPGGVPWPDWLLALAAVCAALYIPYVFEDLVFRIGSAAADRRRLRQPDDRARARGDPARDGPDPAPVSVIFIVYALFGQHAPGVLVHPGASWTGLVNHLYLTSQGIYGIAVGVVATYVFHFVLFGVLATRIGLGQLFLDLASLVAGRYAGGPAKVAVVASALLGMISGSSIANAVTTGSLTIPAMRRVGYPRHFAAAVEADREHRRPDHPADHGRGRVHHGRVPRDPLPRDPARSARPGADALLRRLRDGPSRGAPAWAARPAPGRTAAAVAGASRPIGRR